MASNASFDISTGADLQEVDNAVNQALKEIQQRYDFKGTHCTIEFDRAKGEIRLHADDEFRMKSLLDVLNGRLIKRGVPARNLTTGDFEPATGTSVRCTVTLTQGIASDGAKQITRAMKDNKDLKKVTASIQGDEIRVSSPSKDELQAVIAFLRTGDYGIELKFGNFRS
jgi:cyclic-di-GMP-binding protein